MEVREGGEGEEVGVAVTLVTGRVNTVTINVPRSVLFEVSVTVSVASV